MKKTDSRTGQWSANTQHNVSTNMAKGSVCVMHYLPRNICFGGVREHKGRLIQTSLIKYIY